MIHRMVKWSKLMSNSTSTSTARAQPDSKPYAGQPSEVEIWARKFEFSNPLYACVNDDGNNEDDGIGETQDTATKLKGVLLKRLAARSDLLSGAEALSHDDGVPLPVLHMHYVASTCHELNPTQLQLELLAGLAETYELDVPRLLESLRPEGAAEAGGTLQQRAFAELARLRKWADYLALDARVVSSLSAPGAGQPAGDPTTMTKWHGLCYHRVALFMLCPAMCRATCTEMAYRTSSDLLRGDGRWREMLHSLHGLEPVPEGVKAGVDRCEATLTLTCPTSIYGCGDANIAFPADKYVHCVREQEGLPVLQVCLQHALHRRLPTKLAKALSACAFDGRRGAALAGGGALHACLNSDLRPTWCIQQPRDWDIFVMAESKHGADTVLADLLAIFQTQRVRKTGNAVDLYVPYDGDDLNPRQEKTYKVQVVLRVFANPAHVIMGFDVQACKVVVWADAASSSTLQAAASPAGLEALRHMAVWADPERQSTTYAVRLKKYSAKGFHVVVPMLMREHLTARAMRTPALDASGLTALMLLDGRYHYNRGSRDYVNAQRDVAGDYEVGTRITYNLKRTLKLTRMRANLRAYLARVSGSDADVDIERMPSLPWVLTDPGRQGPFCNCFHPCNSAFYNAYSETVPGLAFLRGQLQ
jgi:hypothetical protein